MIVTILDPHFPGTPYYVSNYVMDGWQRTYISSVMGTPVRSQALRFLDGARATQAAEAARRNFPRCTVTIESE